MRLIVGSGILLCLFIGIQLITIWQRIPSPLPETDFSKIISKHDLDQVQRVVIYGFSSINDLDGLEFPFSILSLPPTLTILAEFTEKKTIKRLIPKHLKYRMYYAS